MLLFMRPNQLGCDIPPVRIYWKKGTTMKSFFGAKTLFRRKRRLSISLFHLKWHFPKLCFFAEFSDMSVLVHLGRDFRPHWMVWRVLMGSRVKNSHRLYSTFMWVSFHRTLKKLTGGNVRQRKKRSKRSNCHQCLFVFAFRCNCPEPKDYDR